MPEKPKPKKRTHPFYGSNRWKSLRKLVTTQWRHAERPCAYCNKAILPGDRTIVDHHLPRRQFPLLQWQITNLVVMHFGCHNKKTARVDKHSTKTKIGPDGFPVGSEWSTGSG